MKSVEHHLKQLESRVKYPCNRRLLAYLLSFPNRRAESISYGVFSTRARLQAILNIRTQRDDSKWRALPVKNKAAELKEARDTGSHKFDFVIFSGTDPRHRQFLPMKFSKAATPPFACPPELVEFYENFDGLCDYTPGDRGFILLEDMMTLGELGSFGKELMATPPKKLANYPVIFKSPSGDCLFLTEDGFFWFGWERGNVKRLAGSFPELMEIYLRHRTWTDGKEFDPRTRHRKQFPKNAPEGVRNAALASHP